MSGQRLRLTTSRKPSYRRGGVAIGSPSAPTLVAPGDTTPQQLLAILTDPNVSVDIETKEGGFHRLTGEERAAMSRLLAEEELKAMGLLTGGEDLTALGAADLVAPPEPNTAEPQGDGHPLDAEASQAGGSTATADSAASAGGAVTSEPTVQPVPPAPEPAAKPTPSPRARGKAKGSPA
ncbi:hypothetical protein [Porphyrobacter sp. YT40]|uniref:hypothetical protein n=1 Tax=Porphyrobacter sp. YT40 TaxID=2547601 RepID=UPI0011442402|nr:hypothetical protein [Porphyrobacter sp. YT40]QDH35845.1 hypothetical protein E2E27_16890 [Porphyrobacter sp. YT40]